MDQIQFQIGDHYLFQSEENGFFTQWPVIQSDGTIVHFRTNKKTYPSIDLRSQDEPYKMYWDGSIYRLVGKCDVNHHYIQIGDYCMFQKESLANVMSSLKTFRTVIIVVLKMILISIDMWEE
jgi:hypothetical protein